MRPDLPVVILTAHGDLDSAVAALRVRACDFMTKPPDIDALVAALERAVRQRRLAGEVSALSERSGEELDAPQGIVGASPPMCELVQLVGRVAAVEAAVLVRGESGTGKELVARALHDRSRRRERAFVALNCAAIPENLLESELFGHEKGAFSGAVTRKIGRFELARGGTLFLDEIADMSLPLQAKILRAVQEREIERVGGGDPIPIDVRLIAASNRELRDAIQQGRFREDLYYRLAVVVVRLPRLAERGPDLALLAAYFVRQFGAQYGKSITGFSDRSLELLSAHRWVGNVRELRNVIEQAVIVATGDTVLVDHLPDEIRGQEGQLAGTMAGELATLAEAEARHIARVLAHTGGQIGAAATILGIHRNTLTRKIREYGL
jgi:DNA-binding NtrC family response regulator